ncbi:Ribosomal RNA small methyltransferase [Heracleum sosnowskyi]|uniref:Ribosomal RNA small methyltransferase n=1 Tax=Heracleum sosnowskyi TaxID=360622 RepID=A0AAD8NC30_9APIA|nr:Ribosomal RNA small methyltransferase [Heracleum sosnowskyi]
MKMKRLASSNGDAKTKSRLQSLIQDYQELQKEVESSRHKLENVKQRKVTLRAEVRFLRRRYKYLIDRKSMSQEQGKELVQHHNVEDQRKKIVKVQIPNKKEAALRTFPLVYKPNHKTQLHTGNEIFLQNKVPSFDLNHKGKYHGVKNATRFYPTVSNLNPKERSYKGKEVVSRQTPITMIDLNKQEYTYNGNGLAAMHTPASVLDLTRNEATFNSKHPTVKSKAPIFDLNQRLVEEEDYQDNCEMVKQDKLSDLHLSLCRNAGDSSSRVVKRKISWQDPVALRV